MNISVQVTKKKLPENVTSRYHYGRSVQLCYAFISVVYKPNNTKTDFPIFGATKIYRFHLSNLETGTETLKNQQ